jgi:hypothetical protein
MGTLQASQTCIFEELSTSLCIQLFQHGCLVNHFPVVLEPGKRHFTNGSLSVWHGQQKMMVSHGVTCMAATQAKQQQNRRDKSEQKQWETQTPFSATINSW